MVYNREHYTATMNYLRKLFYFVIVISFLFSADRLYSQNKIFKKKALFSTGLSRGFSLRRGINLGFQGDPRANLFGSIGYGQASWDAVNKVGSYFCVNFTAGIYSTTEMQFKWGAEASGYLNHIGYFAFSPLIYGATVQFVKDIKHGELYLRPEIGLNFPYKFKPKVDHAVELVFYVVYGFNFPIFHTQFDYSNNVLSLRVLFSFKNWMEY